MNHSRKFATLLLAGGLTLLTAPAFAQTKDPAPATTSTTTSSAAATTPVDNSATATTTATTPAATTPVDNSASMNATSTISADTSYSASHFKMLDTDNDGRISRAEFTAGRQDKLNKLDANSDGTVTADEKAAGKTEKKHWWSLKDKDAKATSTDTVTVDANASAMFDQLDTNHDGYLSEAELAAGRDLKK